MKKYVINIAVTLAIAVGAFFAGMNFSWGEISEREAVSIAEKIILDRTYQEFVDTSEIEIKDVYEVRRYLKGVSDGSMAVFLDKRDGKLVGMYEFDGPMDLLK